MYKIQWSNYSEEEDTWETKDFVRSHFPDFMPKGICMYPKTPTPPAL
jgi:hypothetical protein